MEEKNVIISYETLFEILRVERSRTELQELPKDYSSEVAGMVESDRGSVGAIDDPSEVQKKQIHIKNTLKIIREIYDRREKKINNMALDKSKTNSALIDFSKFLPSEKKLFEEILNILNLHRKNELDSYEEDEQKTEDKPMQAKVELARPEKSDEPKIDSNKELNVELQSVRFISPMPSFLGPSLEEYGPFDEEDVANLPVKIAMLLVRKNRAEKINI